MTNITHPKSICILRLSAIGDVCHAVATVQAIQRRWPSVKISWVIGKVEAKLLEQLQDVEFIVFDKKAGIKGYQDLRKTLKDRHFDILLHMQTAIRASLATLFINATEKWGFDRSRAKEGQWLFTNRKVQAQHQPHVADGFWGFANAIGVNEKSPTWNMPISDKDNLAAHEICSVPFIVISPAASKEQRNWITDRYAAMADYAQSKGYQVIITGANTENEKNLTQQINHLSKHPVIDLVGKTSLTLLLAVLAKAELVIAPDSGPAHMATTVNTPVIGLYAHSNPKRTGPYHSLSSTVTVYEELLLKQTVKSINDNPWGKRVKGDNLMKLITLESVKVVFDAILNDNKTTG